MLPPAGRGSAPDGESIPGSNIRLSSAARNDSKKTGKSLGLLQQRRRYSSGCSKTIELCITCVRLLSKNLHDDTACHNMVDTAQIDDLQ